MLGWIQKAVRKFRNVLSQEKTVYMTCTSYSQAGEDAILRFLFEDKKMRTISYLDVGANTPDYGNNTYLFYTQGHRGVCVEPDVALIPRLKELRPEDTILNAGVAIGESREANLYVFDNKALNTFDKAEAEKRVAMGRFHITATVPVPMTDLNTIIASHFATYPDLLSLDIEGLDLVVLQSMNFEKYPVPVICVETCTYSETHVRSKDPGIASFLETKGYTLYADTYINSIFVKSEWYYG